METSSKLSPDALAERVRAAFTEQAGWCTRLGSPFTALVCATLAQRLDAATVIGSRILSWSGDPSAMGDALPLRVCGALHSLVRSNQEPELAALYPGAGAGEGGRGDAHPGDLWRAIRGALERNPPHFETYLATAPQTNEVGRSAVLMCGFLEIAKRFALPLHLFEIGSSAGLNLVADRYRYRFGNAQWGDPDAALLLEPEWQGPPPPVSAEVRVEQRCGCDIAPLDISVAAEQARLASYVWPDQFDRLARLEAAINTALRDPPPLQAMDAADWVEHKVLVDPAMGGHVRVLFHSIVWRYFPPDTQRRIEAHLERCGALASDQAPLAWLRYEIVDVAPGASLTLKLWPGGEETSLAMAQPHGRSIVYGPQSS